MLYIFQLITVNSNNFHILGTYQFDFAGCEFSKPGVVFQSPYDWN